MLKEEKFIGEAIENVINQTYQDLEIIVVDSGSKDNSKEKELRKLCIDKSEKCSIT